jgi:flap endonuclease-1
MTFANQSKSMVQTMNYQKAIEGLGITHEQFVDLCILLGCDYTDTIKGVGPKTALRLIREHKSIEGILKVIDRKKYIVPADWIPEPVEDDSDGEADENNENNQDSIPEPAYVQARRLFHNHEVTKGADLKDRLKWKEPQVEELTRFLVDENGFNLERVKANIDKLQKAFGANKKPQSRMDSFFSVKPNAVVGGKRKKLEDQSKKQKVAPKKKR